MTNFTEALTIGKQICNVREIIHNEAESSCHDSERYRDLVENSELNFTFKVNRPKQKIRSQSLKIS